jgi:hypothetical protein
LSKGEGGGDRLEQFSTRQYAAAQTPTGLYAAEQPNAKPFAAGQRSTDPYAVDDSEDSDYLRPQIGGQVYHHGGQQQPTGGRGEGEKLAYQSEIRSIIQSLHDLAGSSTKSSEDEDEKEEEARRLVRTPWRPGDDDTTDGESTEYEWEDLRVAEGRQQYSVGGGQTFATSAAARGRHEQASETAAATESFRAKAQRNASFKKAVSGREKNYRLAGSLVQELTRSMEDLHDGFRSLSRAGSIRSLSQRSGGANNSRTESMLSISSRSSHR